MSTRGTRGRGRRRGHGGVRAGYLLSEHQPNEGTREVPALPMTEIGSQNRAARDDALSQAMLRILERKLKGAVSLLRGEAYQWWLTIKKGTQVDRLTWEFLKTTFQAKYVCANYVDARRREFLNLTQGDKSVAEYETEFMHLNHYARGIVATEYEGCVQFEDGLRDGLRVLIAPQRERDFVVLVDKARIADEVKRKERHNREKSIGKRDAKPSNSFHRPKKKARADGLIRADVGSTYSYVAYTVTENLRILVENTSNGIIVLSLLGQSVRVNKLFIDVPLEVQGVIFLADLMDLLFREFDLILGMDWLVKHQVSLDCATKRVVLRTEEDEELVVIGELRNYLSNVISALRAKKLVRKGCKAYLAYIRVYESKGSSIKDIKTVKDFSNIFPNELPRLPPSLEVEFGIELLPSTALVSISPYRMEPKELVELKAQIQELLD
ncbi:uncharacterized protein [Gossypium hirsutum]|uniref:Retrotransposon gag domain-containing protein n=1 Tax=Gossypium hirsutum TaxID=3635 RepID=A0A1U8PVM7_GOSHI|nr:uncharacterized protein LOC107963141 [Gossypium hirsutum]